MEEHTYVPWLASAAVAKSATAKRSRDCIWTLYPESINLWSIRSGAPVTLITYITHWFEPSSPKCRLNFLVLLALFAVAFGELSWSERIWPAFITRKCAPMNPNMVAQFEKGSSALVGQQNAKDMISLKLSGYSRGDTTLLPVRDSIFPNNVYWESRFLNYNMVKSPHLEEWKSIDSEISKAIQRCPHYGSVIVLDEFDKTTLEVQRAVERFLQPQVYLDSNVLVDNRRNIYVIVEELDIHVAEGWTTRLLLNQTLDEKVAELRLLGRKHISDKFGAHFFGRVGDPIVYLP
ncbi:hypothetical protein PAPYR_6454 [Paratrimastix pyriformis]|uniref:ATPase AAA-type core domain-containing protein n=1 Tax=Paratrimastix pyriformis TaxID=342808 RepID=A0ABQ8UF68_9EUKA|nr:hypothetical protein PAPYR_6454 [Paratrimastix pyriformis]